MLNSMVSSNVSHQSKSNTFGPPLEVLVALLACLYLWLHGDAAAKPAQTVAECILEGVWDTG